MRVRDFHFHLPEDLIAQTPPTVRGSSRMLVLNRETGAIADDHFSNLPHHLRSGDLLILNNSRVLPARLFAVRAGRQTQPGSPHPSGRIEVLLTQQLENNLWTALVRPARKVDLGERLLFFAPDVPTPILEAEVIAAGDFGERTLRFSPTPDLFAILDRIGRMPLPPYIHRPGNQPETPEDRDRYQTVYAQQPGSAAAPTAGLHFTPEMIDTLRSSGVQVHTVMLHVGLGTFQPVRVEHLSDIRLHAEPFLIPSATAAAIAAAQSDGRRIIAVGTTSARTLEADAQHRAAAVHAPGSQPSPPPSLIQDPRGQSTDIFLAPGHTFRVINGLLTNFHLPESTLLMLVSAFAGPAGGPDTGTARVLRAYAHAVRERYRFFSYGDCMLVL